MRTLHHVWVLFALLLAVSPDAMADEMILVIEEAPGDGLVVARVDLTRAAQMCGKLPGPARALLAQDVEGKPVDLQFVPDLEFDGKTRLRGTVVVRLAKPGQARLRVRWAEEAGPAPPWSGVVSTPAYSVTHDPKRMGGLPSKITFTATGKAFQTLRWNNRVHHRQSSSWLVGDDLQASVEMLSAGPICAVVRVRGHFVQSLKRPTSEPSAVYDWYYFLDRPLVYVSAAIRQQKPEVWHELHFLEMDYPREALPRWAGGEPLEQGEFKDTKKTHSCPRWGVVHDGRNGIGMFQCGQVLFYDAGPATYIQAHGDSVWQEWKDVAKDYSAWLWIGTSEDPARAVQAAAQANPAAGRVIVSTKAVREKIESARKSLEPAPQRQRQDLWWRIRGAEQLESQGRLQEAVQLAAGKAPAGWTVLTAGDLGAILEDSGGGIRLVDLRDSLSGQALTTTEPRPLFSITLRHAETKEEIRLTADAGWGRTQIMPLDPADAGAGVELRWQAPADKRLGALQVVAKVIPERTTHRLRWQLSAQGQSPPWALWRVAFPGVAIPDLGPQACVLFPKCAGEVQRGVWQRAFRYSGTYPGGWTTMQFMAAYREGDKSNFGAERLAPVETRKAEMGLIPTGLYLAVHDPWGSTKDLICESRPQDQSVVLAYDHPVPDMGLPGNRFELCGEAVWQLLRGDWFDAAVIYRDWVRKEARWYPRLAADGREDTPRWMRELSAWSLGGGRPQDCVGAMKGFAQFLAPPTGFHWYNWHQIPFDNDYPHYFPTHPGFADGVRELQSAGVCVMPYINGRLWDTRDKGAEDFEFTKVARPAVSKNEKGEPYTEVYGSKETDGSPVRLGVMCPSTALWQDKVRGTVLRLMNECGVKGVYIDQIAAAAPTLCFDKTHGHPLGGGHWWTEGYWKLLDSLRQAMPADHMITTECNGEPYIRCFDGYLTWHWQYDGQVPAFPAVYGGSVQMFGRSYGGGETKDLALRMRSGQALVFGEQIGWLSPALAMEKENADFFKSVVHLRRQLRRYFYAGQMARPPQLAGKVPTVRADWQWGGVDWVTTDAVLTGAWHEPLAKRLALVFVNVSDQPVTARVDYDLRPYGFSGEMKLTKITPAGPAESTTTPPEIRRDVTFAPRTAWAWEVHAK